MSLAQVFDPIFLKSIILLIPAFGTALAIFINRPTYFQAIGLMLGILFCIPYLLLLNIAAEYIGWWHYAPTANRFYTIPIELVLGWSILWGAFIPYVFKSTSIFLPLGFAATLDLWAMPMMRPLFSLGDSWLIGEAVLIILCLVPSITIFQLTSNRRHILLRSLIQSLIWGGWTVFLIPSIILSIEGKYIFDLFYMSYVRSILFLFGMLASMFIGYIALFEFAIKGKGTPIPFDPPRKLVTSGIYAYVANPLQISTLLMFTCIMFTYESWLMIVPITLLIIYSEGFVRWHHSVDIETRFGERWIQYRRNVRNWIPNAKAYSSN